MILVLLSLLSHFQTNTHTHTTNLDFFSKAACVIQSLFFNTSGSILPLVYCTIIFSWWRACFWPHWLSLVLPPLQFNPFTWCGVKIRVRRWTIITGRWHRKLPLHKADSEALIFPFFFIVMDLDCQDSLADRDSLHQSQWVQINMHTWTFVGRWLVRMWAPGMVAGRLLNLKNKCKSGQ